MSSPHIHESFSQRNYKNSVQSPRSPRKNEYDRMAGEGGAYSRTMKESGVVNVKLLYIL